MEACQLITTNCDVNNYNNKIGSDNDNNVMVCKLTSV